MLWYVFARPLVLAQSKLMAQMSANLARAKEEGFKAGADWWRRISREQAGGGSGASALAAAEAAAEVGGAMALRSDRFSVTSAYRHIRAEGEFGETVLPGARWRNGLRTRSLYRSTT